MKILGIETSCDETGVAVYEPRRGILAESLYSQTALHARFGGVVPELASRDHIARLTPMIRKVLADAEVDQADLGGIAYTAGPGLVGALMVGGSLATALAMGLGTPVIPVHHMEAHLLAVLLEDDPPAFPFVALLVSGGHSLLVETRGLGEYAILGETLDDAAGEAFDKVARLLSLPYPGGPALAALAQDGDPAAFRFPRPMLKQGLNFSFSGLKTAVRLALERSAQNGAALSEPLRADVAASFQAAAVETLVEKCLRACEETGLARLVVAGGVGANVELRRQLKVQGGERGIAVHYPRQSLCTDNGAMIALAGWHRRHEAAGTPAIIARPRWPLDELRPPAAALIDPGGNPAGCPAPIDSAGGPASIDPAASPAGCTTPIDSAGGPASIDPAASPAGCTTPIDSAGGPASIDPAGNPAGYAAPVDSVGSPA